MLIKSFALLLILGLSNYNAQSLISKQVLTTKRDNLNEINILAVMVEFQKDDFELTYGDGTFGTIYTQDYGTDILDPLPHDQNYFKDHLEFAVNYYDKVSDGKVKVTYTILPDIYTVSKTMREYSPVDGESFKLLADFSKEVWEIVDNSNNSINYSEYNTFVIFHAGVGKDISTSDLFGEARDLPSIYLGLKSFKEFYGESFAGFQVGNNELVTNSLILPETESREETTIVGTTLLQLSINGLIVSSIASRMGLPDLFDAETGKSAIGRFGLMDGQSLFAYAGVFPPEPSAWEKVFLGWEEVVEVNENRDNILVSASRAADLSETKIVKIPINSTEYFLIENRNRDVNNDGITLTYKVAGETRTIKFSEDLDNFNNAFVDTLKGVILDVDEYDWAVPGSGLLIWHIDEKIIANGIEVNKINVGNSRGVDLEEADGIQDIGEEFQTIFGDIIIAEGDENDLWHSENNSQLFTNSFNTNTKPNSKSNSGANSLITLDDFSNIANQMSFDVSFGSSGISLETIISIDPSLALSNYKIVPDENNLTFYAQSGSSLYRISESIDTLKEFSINDFSIIQHDSEDIIIGGINNNLNVVSYNQGIFKSSSADIGSIITAPITTKKIDNQIEIFVGLENGTVSKYSMNFSSIETSPILEETIDLFGSAVDQVVSYNNGISAVSNNELYTSERLYTFPSKIVLLANSNTKNGGRIEIILTEENFIYTIQNEDEEYKLIYKGQEEIKSIALADLKNDGENYIVFSEENVIHAINSTGSYADKFPFKLADNGLVNFPLIADLNSDGISDIISVTSEGDIYGVSGSEGLIINGFPISTGGIFSGNLSISQSASELILSSITETNNIYTWKINSSGSVDWGSRLGNNFNNPSLEAANDKNFISQFFPSSRTYNWPNPVYGNETFVRTYVGEDSDVKVKVFDLAGDLVDEFDFVAQGGVDTEYAWSVVDIQSGAYFAHLEVKSSSGKTKSKIIKIAIVK